MYPEELKYTKTHEWIKVEGEIATIGITDFATKSQNLDLISKDPYGEGWMIRVRIENVEEIKSLMDSREYEEWIKQEEKSH